MRAAMLGGILLVQTWGVPTAPVYTYPTPNGYMVQQGGQAPTFVYRIPNDGYMVTQPGNPPSFIHPLPSGGTMEINPPSVPDDSRMRDQE